jgi:hypothetical protein
MESTPTPIQTHRFILVEKLLKMMQASLAIEPILVNLLAITLAIGIVVLLNHPTLFPQLGKYHHYFTYVIYGLILLQTIKSANKSLFIPVIALAIAGAGFLLLRFNLDWQWVNLDELKKLMLLGVIGLGTAIFVMG